MSSKNFLNPSFSLDFQDLYAVEGLEKIHKKFLEFLQEKAPEYFLEYQIHNAENSQYLIEIAKILEIFLVELFLIHEKNSELKMQYLKYKKVCETRRDFIQRHIAKKYSQQDLESIKNFDHQKILQNLAINFSQIDEIEIALSDKILAKQDLEIIEIYCLWALFDEAGQKFHKAGTLFILPQKIVIKNLIPKIS